MRKNMALPWFRPKSFGYGASPASWQGWRATASFIVLVGLDTSIFHGLLRLLSVVVLTGAFIILVYAKTGAEWKWRSGRS